MDRLDQIGARVEKALAWSLPRFTMLFPIFWYVMYGLLLDLYTTIMGQTMTFIAVQMLLIVISFFFMIVVICLLISSFWMLCFWRKGGLYYRSIKALECPMPDGLVANSQGEIHAPGLSTHEKMQVMQYVKTLPRGAREITVKGNYCYIWRS